jgi:outer membrane biosynthesis protein TonB
MEDRLDKRHTWNTISCSLPTKPMRTLFATLLLTSVALPLLAQSSNAPWGQSVPPRIIAPAAVKTEKAEKAEKAEKPKTEKAADSRTFLKRLFGPRPTPTPVPTAPPAPSSTAKNKRKPKPGPAVMPQEATARTTPTTAGVKPKIGKGAVKKGTPTSTDPAGLDDGAKFKTAKSKALEDAKIAELKSKAGSEVDEAAAAKASAAYNHALFQKIREIDPSVGDYATKVEHALTKRVSSEKGRE